MLLAEGVVIVVRRTERFSARDPLVAEMFPPADFVLVLCTNATTEFRDKFLSAMTDISANRASGVRDRTLVATW